MIFKYDSPVCIIIFFNMLIWYKTLFLNLIEMLCWFKLILIICLGFAILLDKLSVFIPWDLLTKPLLPVCMLMWPCLFDI